MNKTNQRDMEKAFKSTWTKNQGDSLFLELFSAELDNVWNKKEHNKKLDSYTANLVIIFSGLSSAVNIIVSSLTFNSQSQAASWFSITASGFSIVVTSLIALKKNKQYKETWLRHQKNYAKIYSEMYNYTFCLDEYKESDSRNELFMDRIGKLHSDNQSLFEHNMSQIKEE